MLKGINPIVSPELLKALCEMGHGDELVIADGNFPCESIGKNAIVIRADGHSTTDILDAVLSLIPLDMFLEAPSPELRPELEAFARKLSGTVIWADSAQRCKVHLAAVFACNFANHMYAVGERIVRGAGLDFDVLKPLIAETAAKACDARSPLDVQTGPAVRNDFATKARHGDLLAFDLRLKNIYSTISQSIWETSKKI